MKKLLTLLVLGSAAAAQAQSGSSGTWPVQAQGASCSISQAFDHSAFGRNALQVSYEPRAQRITLTATAAAGAFPSEDRLRLGVVFLNNANEAYDPGWGLRTFRRAGAPAAMATAFEGRKNVEQILSDLASSQALGLLYDGEIVTGYELQDAASGIARLRACASRLAG